MPVIAINEADLGSPPPLKCRATSRWDMQSPAVPHLSISLGHVRAIFTSYKQSDGK